MPKEVLPRRSPINGLAEVLLPHSLAGDVGVTGLEAFFYHSPEELWVIPHDPMDIQRDLVGLSRVPEYVLEDVLS